MSKSRVSFRTRAFALQSGRCFYCGLPMWNINPMRFARRYEITPSQALDFKCTAEHLKARRDGGIDQHANVVAACLPLQPDAPSTQEAAASGAVEDHPARQGAAKVAVGIASDGVSEKFLVRQRSL
jgi:hypothetical protein